MTIKSIAAAVDGSTSTFVRSDGTAAAAGGGGGPAESLDTTGSAVDVSGSAPPNTGDVLTATSATTATWQAPSGGSGLTQPQVLARGLGS
jgi:hypothetical protein